MFNTLKAKLGLGNQEQAVNSIELAENEVQLWDEMDDETAAVYGGGKRNRRANTLRKRIIRNNNTVFRALPPGNYSVRYRAVLRTRKVTSRRTKTNTTSKTGFSSANSFNL